MWFILHGPNSFAYICKSYENNFAKLQASEHSIHVGSGSNLLKHFVNVHRCVNHFITLKKDSGVPNVQKAMQYQHCMLLDNLKKINEHFRGCATIF